MLNKYHAKFLSQALQKILKTSIDGSMAYIRSLDCHLIRVLCSSQNFTVSGWKIYGVVDQNNDNLITADKAIEFRENKKGAILLLVDVESAGAGMDGIYSAAREIGEVELFEKAIKEAKNYLPPSLREFVDKAVKKAKRIGNKNTISPWQEFDCYCQCAEDNTIVGEAVACLGLWPIQIHDEPDATDLDKSVRLVEKLLLVSGSANTSAVRVESLMLKDATQPQRDELEKFIRNNLGVPWREAIKKLRDIPELWLHAITPGIFDTQTLQKIYLVPWQKNRDTKPYQWSGLIKSDEEGGRLAAVINLNPLSAKDRSKIEVRWKTLPEDLKKGSVEYLVEVVAGDDVLAEQKLVHSENNFQRCQFTNEDFQNLDEEAKFEAKIVIRSIGAEEVDEVETEDFLLLFGQPEGQIKSGIGPKVRALVEAACSIKTKDGFLEACSYKPNEDKKGFVTFRYSETRARVFRPPLIKEIEESWAIENGAIGRWVVRVRIDGSKVGSPEFLPLSQEDAGSDPKTWEKIGTTSRLLSELVKDTPGLIGFIHSGLNSRVDDYINAWATALESGKPILALANTVEVKTLSGKTLGVIVLPSHPLRLAWHYAYDMLVQYARYEDKAKDSQLVKTLQALDGSHFPAFLPGLKPGESFVFGDTLGFYAIAMVRDTDKEPKAALAQIAKSLSAETEDVAPSIGNTTSEALSKEIGKYSQLHPNYHTYHIHALRAGDGMTITKALGQTFKNFETDDLEEQSKFGYILELYPSQEQIGIVGRFLTETTQKRRTGAGTISQQDRWLLENYLLEGGIPLPKLRWAKREQEEPENPAHLSVSFDTFDSKVVCLKKPDVEKSRPLQVYGLVSNMNQQFAFSPQPVWLTYVALNAEGEKHLSGGKYSDRLLKLQSAILKTVTTNLGGSEDEWPALQTNVSFEKEESLKNLHHLSDWVITVDRNAGIEYFDSPREAQGIYDAYIIDCVPERQQMGHAQLVTSTKRLDEVKNLLEDALESMALSLSSRNCEFLLSQLKALSGRLAMRLANKGVNSGELIALALVHANCVQAKPEDSTWFSLSEGFLIPLDDVLELLPTSDKESGENQSNLRADLVYVTVSKRGGLQFRFIEVKYRRHLKTVRQSELLETIEQQTENTKQRWIDLYFTPKKISPVELAIHRTHLASILRFYADKARRHNLTKQFHNRILQEIDKLVTDGGKYQFSPTQFNLPCRGYIFCPDYSGSSADEIPYSTNTEIFLFGSSHIPDSSFREAIVDKNPGFVPAQTSSEVAEDTEKKTVNLRLANEFKETYTRMGTDTLSSEIQIHLGDIYQKKPVYWTVSIASNPHLLIAGLPGMGKTTSLMNICTQLLEHGITPIVFSYHEDIDEKLIARLGKINVVDYDGLGFNPLRVVHDSITAYLDNAGMLRDIFVSIFPDLGDIQTDKIRQAIKESYTNLGWGFSGLSRGELEIPSFQTFYDILVHQSKPDKGLIARLNELNDYGFFRNTGTNRSLLQTTTPSILRIHKTQNEVLQRAFAAFVLHNLYQEMFIRGVQNNLTHAIVFDEAHRASTLKLLPTMAKECRKYGITLIVASQEAKDFHSSIFSAIGNYLVLKLNEVDAKALANNVAPSDSKQQIIDQLKQMPKYHGLFFCEGQRRPAYIALKN